MTTPQTIQRFIGFLRSVPNKYYIFGGAGLLVILYGILFLIPRQVAFSYAGPTCNAQLTILPGIQSTQDSKYDVAFEDQWKVGGVALTSGKTCLMTKVAPVAGSSVVGTAPFNSPFMRTLYAVSVATPPAANVKTVKKEVPTTKHLLVPLDSKDIVHDYVLKVADASAPCKSHSNGLECDIPSLKLTQGTAYQYTLTRAFKSGRQSKVGSGDFQTLRAITVTGGTVTPNQIMYPRSKVIEYTADKSIDTATVELTSDGGPIELTQKVDGTKVTLTLKDELPREKPYRLTIKNLEAQDGSTLTEPYVVSFKTSGGPKVTKVSVGASGVAQNASIILTFDQTLSKTKDITQFIGLTGGQATVKKQSDTQVVVQLGSLPLCAPFTITAKQGLPSEHDVAATQNWMFNSRTTCYLATTYGTSLKGRALTAYQFGSSGPVTMYVGGIHGNEPSSTSLMKDWITQLEANPGRFAGKRIVVVPAINPDGLATGSRTNSRGVNLNRNFPTDNWVKSIKDTDGTHPSGGGDKPLSEPEASALARLTTSYRPRLLLSFHAVGSLAIGDPGGYSAGYAAKYASMVGYRNGTSSTSDNFDYNVTGGYEDWTYRNQAIPSMVIELSSYNSVYSAGHFKALWAMLD